MRIVARLFVTDAERYHNAASIIAAARAGHLFVVLCEFCSRCNAGAPPFADDLAMGHVRGVIRAMVAEGSLDARHEQQMLTSLHFSPDGKTSGCIVSMFDEVVDV